MKHLAIRLTVSLFTFIIGLASVGMLTPLRFDAASNAQAEREILRVERAYIQAHVERDTATLDDLLADEFTIGRSHGRGMNKSRRLSMLLISDFSFAAIDTDNVAVEVNGESAVLTGGAVVHGWYGERSFTSPHYHFARKYEKREGRWQIVSVSVRR